MQRLAALASWGSVLILLAASAPAEDFHVETKVFKIGDTKPILQTKTLFVKGVVYDFLQDPNEAKDPETTIFDPRGRRFVVLDPQRKMCSEVSLQDIQEFTSKLKIEAAGHTEPLLNFLSDPKFEQKADGDQLEFNSNWMIYRLKTNPARSDEVARQYAEFSHWQGQFNVMINPRSLPPFGRMVVNETLAKRKLLPLEVYMTISPKESSQKLVIRAEHRFQWQLLETDRQQVDEAQRQLKIYRQVSLDDYNHRVDELTQNPKAKAKTPPK